MFRKNWCRKGFCFKKKKQRKKTTEHVKGKFSKTKGTLCNVPIESVNICDILHPASN